MNNCLSDETINLLSARRLRGRGLVDALKHLETCADCRARVRMPTRDEILRRLAPDEDDDSPNPPPSAGAPDAAHSPAGKERDESFQKLLDRLRGKTEFRLLGDSTIFHLSFVFSFLPSSA